MIVFGLSPFLAGRPADANRLVVMLPSSALLLLIMSDIG
jgi:hypothetical protein